MKKDNIRLKKKKKRKGFVLMQLSNFKTNLQNAEIKIEAVVPDENGDLRIRKWRKTRSEFLIYICMQKMVF